MIFDNNRSLTVRIHTFTLLLLLLLSCVCFTLPECTLIGRTTLIHMDVRSAAKPRRFKHSGCVVIRSSVTSSHVCRARAAVIDFSTGVGLTFSIRSPSFWAVRGRRKKPFRNSCSLVAIPVFGCEFGFFFF